MDIKSKLMQKIGIMSANLSTEFIQLDVDDRIPTVALLSEKYQTARGTVQSALKLLQDYNAIKLESRGHLGTFITYIDYLKLLEIAGIKSLVGVMPLPYSKRYEGLATGIFNTLNHRGLAVNLAFMRGSNHRLKALLDGRYDFAVTSRLTADYYIKNHEPIEIVVGFGDFSYVNEHVLVVREEYNGQINKGMKVGIDRSSIDQALLTLSYFKNYEVEYIDMSYSSFKTAIKTRKVDAAIWNKDDIDGNEIKTIDISKKHIGISDTEAVIITANKNTILPKLFSKNLDRGKVLRFQKEVLEGIIMPNY
ncbi:GntR family transcriptional regulator YhfZ [Clostridium frigidicarnis]|uniref:Helix-turn-helix domain-containing protein n=1 Tax=Clostridium frigidicarnis TaxID=84698 RepID=A0A1I0ZKD9_9CLOT|nr:GntR family transcriptional regulator YhfZ [Clostridium frigidicarnis]SFB25822.1 Helix-turn-helix domain-containing protein [Clostridium frigidicarnis]